MSESKEKTNTGKKPLRLSRPRRLELEKTVETGQVRQSFPHGRSRSVTVEVKRKRTFAPGAGGRMTEVKPSLQAAAAQSARQTVRSLTEQEKAARVRALQDAIQAEEEGRDREDIDALLKSEEERRRRAEEEALREEEERRRAEEEERRRRAEEEAARRTQLEEMEQRRARPAAAKAERPARRTETEEEEAERRRGRRRADVRRTPVRHTEPRRRGKLTVTQALDGEVEEERGRSLAAVRRARERERQRAEAEQPKEPVKVVREVVIPEAITVQELSNRMAERGADVIKALMKMGVMATINQTIDADTAELLAREFGHRVKRVSEADVEIGLKGAEDVAASLKPRAPVVTVMGHVDHGKTSLLDVLRETDVAQHEAGGITQHIGAYRIKLSSGAYITFLDTPGHEAFTAMRARGANVTDIVVLVVAADDGIKDQTVEAINHAQAAKVPIIVAINKIDRPDADPNRVRTQLLQHGVVLEEMGGEILGVEVSAKEKLNLDKLEEAILLQAELLELKANPDRAAEGVIVEAKLERGRGPVATVLVQRGTLRVGDIFVAGSEWGRVRAMVDERGQQVEDAGPSVPVEVLGLQGTPSAGDDFVVVENEARAREIADYRQRQLRDRRAAGAPRGTVEQMFTQIAEGQASELPMVVKTDVQGSLEAILGSVEKLSTDEVAVRVLHAGVGGINESDVQLAKASNAMILGFNVRANPQARELARRENIEIRYYSIIYDVIDDLKKALSGLLMPEIREQFLGTAEIREVFSISKVGKVAGCRVTEGVVRRGAKVRLLRDNVVIHEGNLASLRRFKEEAREVKEGYECGIALEGYQDIQVGDVIECYEMEEVARSL